MSGGHPCPCQLDWPVDTNGFKRDTINSEKAWLDFAVRYLSREAAGKGNGQEAVWSQACKPFWWDNCVGLEWKNPTTNPKDNKDVLLKKYEALENRLRLENKFPSDLEEEAKLWSDGNYKELFLLCNLTCLLKKVSGVHSAIVEACSKATKMKAHINQGVVDSIRACLGSALQETEKFTKCQPTSLKRQQGNKGREISDTDNVVCKKVKCENVKKLVPILPKPNQLADSVPISPGGPLSSSDRLVGSKHDDILNLANKMLEKRRHPSKHTKLSLKQKLTKRNPSGSVSTTSHSAVNSLDGFNELNTTIDSTVSFLDLLNNTSNSTTSPHSILSSPPLNNNTFDFSPSSAEEAMDYLLSPMPMPSQSQDLTPISNNSHSNTISNLAFPPTQVHPSNTSLVTTDIDCGQIKNSNIVYISCPAQLSPLLSEPSRSSSIDHEPSSNSIHSSITTDSNHPSPNSMCGESQSANSSSSTFSDCGYISAEGLNLENIFTDEEYNGWGDTGSYSLDRYLFDDTDTTRLDSLVEQ